MAQGCIQRNVSGQICEDWISDYSGTNYSYQSEVNCLRFVDDFQQGDTIKRLSIKRRPRVANNHADRTQSGISYGQWHSTESLSTSGSDDTRLLGMLSSTTKERPPLPPQHCSSLDSKLLRNERATAEQTVSHILNESKPQPAARSLSSQRQSTQKPLDQDGTSQTPPQPQPRRRLASFGGVSSPGSLSPFTGLSAYNQNNNGNKPAGTGGEMQAHLSSSLGTRGSTGCLRLSPESSGRSTPISGLGPVHLQHVRDQMVVALQKLKEMEEQVKIIPILQVKISVLQEEKRQLISQLKNQSDDEDTSDGIWKRLDNSERSDTGKKVIGSDSNDVKEFRQLNEEMQALERTIKGGSLPAWHGKGHSLQKENTIKSVTVGSDKDRDRTLSKPLKENKYVCTDRLEMKSVGTEVYEGNLGIYTEREAEFDAQQLIIGTLKERIRHLEAELKESALQKEMSRLKLELHAAGARNRSDKASSARPSTDGTGIVARPNTTSQGVGNHREYRDASTGEATEVRSIGTCCYKPEFKDVGAGPDVPMSKWVVRERVEVVEKGVGNHVFTNTQGVGMEMKLCDAETNTEVPLENLDPKRGKIKYNSAACGDCSVDVIIYEAKEMVSQGISTNQVRGVNQGVMASPHTASQRTNTVSSSVSRFTSTRHAFNTDSSTNTVLSTKDKHTNTAQAITRTASVGTRFRDMKCTPETCTSLLASALKQTQGTATKVTKDTGVGFTDINDNFLVGLKTRNMASGPSHLPDPMKTRSIGVGEGRIRDLTSSKHSQKTQQSAPSQWEPELNHYIEKMHRLLKEHGNLLTEDCTHQREGFVSHPSKQDSASTRVSSNGKVATQGGTEIRPLDVQLPVSRKFQSPSQLSVEHSKCDKANPETSREGANDSEVKRMIQMLEQQTSSALQDKSTNMLQSVIKKQNGDQGCSSSRKSMKFLRLTTGLEPVSPNKVNSEEGGDKRGRKKIREATQDGMQTKKVSKSVSTKGGKGYAKPQQRCKLGEKVVSACQALKAHLNDDTALSSKELHDCVQTLQQEWFSVSSQKSADADMVEDYLSTFRIVSPSVLQHIANMADGNGNTALHYSVSHSNFGIVRKLLDAEVCSVDHQNKAGYTPIMLAALSAVESPEDMRVVEKLFTKGDVNAKASQAGQTALMLAVSHGRMGMVQALLRRGADVNLQDDEGSTALMCASEHGHADIVRLLLAQADCDTTLTDNEDSTALSIALEAGHNDIAVLLYAHANFSKGQTGMSGSRVSH